MARDTETIERDIPEPAWRQLAAILRGRILRGRYQPGHAIPSEAACQREWDVSRGTCRKAVALLRSEGLIVTVAGRGSYVASEEELRAYRED
jgi:DNA-binding GntR family transcriptional regulator